MSRSAYNLKKLSLEEQQARYEVINKFVGFNPFFAYLPYITNPTNNYQKYSNESLNSILLTLQYGNIEDDNDPIKKVYLDFVNDYQYNSAIYIREQKEKMLRYQHEQQLIAQQLARQQSNAGTQAISFNSNPNNAQKQHPQQHETHRRRHHEEYHLWHKFHTKAGDTIGFDSKAEYDEFAHFKEKYGLDIKIKFDPLAKFESEIKLFEEDKPASEPIPQKIEIVPKVISEPVIVVSEHKPKKPNISEVKKPQNSISKDQLYKKANVNIVESQQQLIKRRHDRIAEQQFTMLFGMKSQQYPIEIKDKNQHHLWHRFHNKIGDVIEFDSKAAYDQFEKFKEKYGLAVKIKYNPDKKQFYENSCIDEAEVSKLQPKKKRKSKRKGKGKVEQEVK